MSMPPHMRGAPQQNIFQRGGGGPPQQNNQNNAQQLMQRQDEKLAAALQAHEYHRSLHPSRVNAGPSGQHPDALGALIMGGGGAGRSGNQDPEREARHKARDEQLKIALEVNPEAFVSVPMLYVQCLLNNTPVKAFVDTGAQMTVMTVQCAKACNLLNVIGNHSLAKPATCRAGAESVT